MTTSANKQKKTFYVSLRWKLLIGFTLIFSLVFAGAFLWFYNFSTETSLNRIKEDLVNTLNAAAEKTNGDELESLIKEGVVRESDGYTDDPRFWKQIDFLGIVFTIEPRSRPYIYTKGEKPGELIFIASGCTYLLPESDECPKFMQRWITDNPEPNLSGLNQITLQNETQGCAYYKQAPGIDPTTGETTQGIVDETCKLKIYTDDFGQWVSAFAPIKNSKGEIVAGMGMDFESSYVLQVQKAIESQVVVAFLIVYGLLFILVFSISEFFTRPMRSLTQAATFIGEGDYEKSLAGLDKGATEKTLNDEIGQLSKMFQLMIGKVYQREQSLRKQVEELQIEIDEAKRQKQVSEIVDTDFFYDLQQRARQMRQRRSSQTPPEKNI